MLLPKPEVLPVLAPGTPRQPAVRCPQCYRFAFLDSSPPSSSKSFPVEHADPSDCLLPLTVLHRVALTVPINKAGSYQVFRLCPSLHIHILLNAYTLVLMCRSSHWRCTSLWSDLASISGSSFLVPQVLGLEACAVMPGTRLLISFLCTRDCVWDFVHASPVLLCWAVSQHTFPFPACWRHAQALFGLAFLRLASQASTTASAYSLFPAYVTVEVIAVPDNLAIETGEKLRT